MDNENKITNKDLLDLPTEIPTDAEVIEIIEHPEVLINPKKKRSEVLAKANFVEDAFPFKPFREEDNEILVNANSQENDNPSTEIVERDMSEPDIFMELAKEQLILARTKYLDLDLSPRQRYVLSLWGSSLNLSQIAENAGVNISTICKWKKDDLNFIAGMQYKNEEQNLISEHCRAKIYASAENITNKMISVAEKGSIQAQTQLLTTLDIINSEKAKSRNFEENQESNKNANVVQINVNLSSHNNADEPE